MKVRTFFLLAFIVVLATAAVQAADDGPLFTRNLSRTPDTMTGASQMSIMWLYVPAQDTQGEPPDTDSGELEYYAGDCTNQDIENCTLVYSRPEAKPIVATYNDGLEHEDELTEIDLLTGAGFGDRDAFAALSLDDGATWKNYNLSDSASRSSFTLQNGHEYPGDVFKLVHAVEGNAVVAAWVSRYCESGAPLYSWTDDVKSELLTYYPELDHHVDVDNGTDDDYQLYLDDLFSVGGSQGSVDYSLQGFPEVGEIPYGCVWVARGTLEQDLDDNGAPLVNSVGDPVYDITWRAAERLTSGRRDPHQISITSSPGAGFVVFWQEDPEGLRPGKGLGPGEGWSGAIANSRTDIWYSYIDIAHIGDVCVDEPTVNTDYCTPGTIAEYNDTTLFAQKPKAAVPFAMPVRLTDNNMCKADPKVDSAGELLDAYCFADFNENGTPDLCNEEILWQNSGDEWKTICVAEDGRVMNGRTASTRVRAAMKSYDSDSDGVMDSAWVLFGEEKLKSLGTVGEDPSGIVCDPSLSPGDPGYVEDCVPVDIGKNMWYHTFEFDKPELVQQGLMLNAPATVPFTTEFFPTETDEFGYDFYDTEIARRFNLFVNSAPVAMASDHRTMGILIYKQGILFQGGPADIFIRRIVLPDDFDPAVDNPFAYENVQCVEFADDGTTSLVDLLYPNGENPNYVRGLCPVNGMNISGTTIVECDSGATPADTCAAEFPFDMTYEEWDNEADETQLPKVTEWVQAPDNFNDQSWENPYDVSKGHRGFIDGDFVMMMYATAPNWKAGTTGNEAYNLYIRRSFDGGVTWTTLPADYTHWDGTSLGDLGVTADGTTTCEDYGWGGTVEEEVCTTYVAGEFEQARNVSRLTGAKVTVLDPRYSPSGGMLKRDYKSLLCDPELDGVWENCGFTEATYLEDVRDPSTFFATFETGDNTVVSVETGANPLDMFYSRASNFGDDWDEQDACSEDVEDPWYPSASCTNDLPDMRWDWLENGDDWATEASVEGNPNGDRFYAVWNQELPVDVEAEIYADMDTEFRRIFFNLTDVDTAPVGTIIYQSDVMVGIVNGDNVELVGYGRDYDRLGEEDIVAYEWTSDIDGVIGTDRVLSIPASSLSIGRHTISFRVQDAEGNWSTVATTRLMVVEQVSKVFMPSIAQ